LPKKRFLGGNQETAEGDDILVKQRGGRMKNVIMQMSPRAKGLMQLDGAVLGGVLPDYTFKVE
jgi:hypothetical protein